MISERKNVIGNLWDIDIQQYFDDNMARYKHHKSVLQDCDQDADKI